MFCLLEMHQYLDSDGSGTSDVCVSNTIGASRLADATAWLQSTGIKGFLGEICPLSKIKGTNDSLNICIGEMGAGSNTDCIEAGIYNRCCLLSTN